MLNRRIIKLNNLFSRLQDSKTEDFLKVYIWCQKGKITQHRTIQFIQKCNVWFILFCKFFFLKIKLYGHTYNTHVFCCKRIIIPCIFSHISAIFHLKNKHTAYAVSLCCPTAASPQCVVNSDVCTRGDVCGTHTQVAKPHTFVDSISRPCSLIFRT